MDRTSNPKPHDETPDHERHVDHDHAHEEHSSHNPPRTTDHGVTAPKFGSAGSGGAELEPGPEKD